MSLFELDNGVAYAHPVPLRHETRNPANPACPHHLRRICGTCAFFPVGEKIKAQDQTCGKFETQVDGLTCAFNCKFWTRKSAQSENQ